MPRESIAPLYEEGPAPGSERDGVDAEAEEGLLLAEYATRMRLKNRIVVDTMSGSGRVDVEAWTDEARLALGRLRVEAEQSARRMVAERDAAARSRGLARHEHDYRRRDAANLEHRRLVYTAVARRLLRWENDDARVRDLLAAARDDAYREIRSAITAMLARQPAPPAEDRTVLEERLRLIAEIDLPALAARRDVGEGASPAPLG